MAVVEKPDSLVSVVIPVYNAAPYLKRCLDSVIGQTYENLEIILVDDGSTDNSAGIMEEYAGCDSRIRIFRQENKGQSAARNAGIDASGGEWIVFVDSDDETAPNMVKVLLEAVLHEDAELGTGAYWFYNEESGEKRLKHIMPGVHKGKESFGEIFCTGKFAMVWACIFRRSIFDKHRFPEGSIYEDTYLLAHVLCDIKASVCVDVPVYIYYQHMDGTSRGSGFGERVYRQFCVWQEIKAYVETAAPEYLEGVCEFMQEAALGNFCLADNRELRKQFQMLKEIKMYIGRERPEYTKDFQYYLLGICRGILYLIDEENQPEQLWALKELEVFAENELPEYISSFRSNLFWVCCKFLYRVDRLGRNEYPKAWSQAVAMFSDIKGKRMDRTFFQRTAIVLFDISPVLYVKTQKIYSMLRGTEELWM